MRIKMNKFNKLFEETLTELSVPFTKKWDTEKKTKSRSSKKTDGWELIDNKNGNDFLRYDDGKETLIDVSKRDNKWHIVLTLGKDSDRVKNTTMDDFISLKDLESFIMKKSKVGINKKKFENSFK